MRLLVCFRIVLIGLGLLAIFFTNTDRSLADLTKESKMGPSDIPLNSIPIYRFHEHLADAEAFILEPGKEEVAGIWRESAIIFPNFTQDFLSIGISSSSYNGVSETGIFFHTFPGTVRRLRFHNIPAGSSLILYYGIDDEGVNPSVPEDTPLYLRVWAGKHELKRLRIPTGKGWHKEVVSLGVLPFLKHAVTMTFETTSENREGRRLSFRAEILP